jgi:hypothetical protein
MSKRNYQTVYGVKVYPIEYIGNHELTENELNNLLDDNNKGLKYSLIISMFKSAGINMNNHQIVKIITSNNRWMYNYRWEKTQCDNFTDLLIEAYKNIYSYQNMQAKSLAQWFIIKYGFPVKGIVIDFEK